MSWLFRGYIQETLEKKEKMNGEEKEDKRYSTNGPDRFDWLVVE